MKCTSSALDDIRSELWGIKGIPVKAEQRVGGAWLLGELIEPASPEACHISRHTL